MTTLTDPTKPLSPLAQFRRRVERLRIARMAHRDAPAYREQMLWDDVREATRDLNDWTAMYADDLLQEVDGLVAEVRRLSYTGE